jgi:hypothetical protein
MSIIRSNLKHQIRVSRPRRAADKTAKKMDSPLSASGAYAGYPYDPYA